MMLEVACLGNFDSESWRYLVTGDKNIGLGLLEVSRESKSSRTQYNHVEQGLAIDVCPVVVVRQRTSEVKMF